MVDLYRVADGKIESVEELPFKNEIEDMKKFIRENERLLDNIKIFAEEATPQSSAKPSDFLAVDKDGNIVIIELKNTKVTAEVISQVLQYRTSWLKSIDTVKKFWYDFKSKLKASSIDEPEWASFNPKIQIVASEIDEEVLEVAATNNLEIDFIEIRRYMKNGEVFVTVDMKDAEDFNKKPTPGRKIENYDWAHYGNRFGDKWVELARHYVEKLEQLKQARNWNLNIRYNKYYVAFKYESRSPFILERSHVDKISIAAVGLKDPASEPPSSNGHKWVWDKNWNYWYLELDDKNLDVNDISDTLQKAYDKAARI